MRYDKNHVGWARFVRGSLAVTAMVMLMVTSILVIIPEEANAETRPGGTLINDAPARTERTGWWWTDTPDDLQFKVPSKTNRYTAMAVLNRETGEDFDLFIFSDYEMESKIASSTKGSDEIDFVVVDGHTYTGNYKYAKVYKFTGSDWNSGVWVESDYHSTAADLYGSDPDADGPLDVGENRYSLFERHTSGYSGTLDEGYPLVNIYDVYLDAEGEYDFDLSSVNSQLDLSMYLFKGSGNADDSLVSDSATSNGDSLSFSYQPEASGWYGLCVINNNNRISSSIHYTGYSNTDNYTLLVSSDFEISADPTSQLIAPGMNASYEVDVDSLGITGDIDLHYRWNSGSSNITSPSGADVTMSRSTVTPGGVDTEKVYLNVSTTSSLSAGTYYIDVYGNDTGVNGKTHWTTITLVVSTNPDFFLQTTPDIKVISPSTAAVYRVEMDTINNFTSNVTLSASSSPSTSDLNFTFSPTYINALNPSANLTITADGDTDIGTYNISVWGTGGSLTRYSNTTLRIKEPISIDIISPGSSGEIVSGVYTFQASAGTPSDTKSVEITFGGKLINLGTLTMYYNSANGFWERTVNTFSFIDGASSINITAEDYGSGLTSVGPLNFTLSNSAPNPIINRPLDRTYVTGTSMPISVNTTTQVISARFRVDQNAWTPLSRSGNTWTGTWDTTLTTDGEHTLTIDAKDTAGLTGETSITIFVDNTRPTCSLNSPIDGQYLEGTYTFRVVATDTVGVHHVDIDVFGQTTTLPYNPVTSSYEYTISTETKPDGTYTVQATAYDNVNLSRSSDSITFYIDNNDPTLSINSPDSEEIIGGIYNISVTSSDLFLQKVEYRIDSGGWMNLSGMDPDWWVHLNTSNYRDGMHTLSVRSLDEASHLTEQSVDFYVDNTNPTCNLVSPFEGRFLEGVFTFQVSASDTVGIDRVVLDLFSDTVQTTLNQQTGYYEYQFNTLTISDGTYNVTAMAYDLSGKTTESTTINFKVDNLNPDLAIVGLQTGDYVSGNITFSVNVSDAFLKDVMYSVDGGAWVNITQTWVTTSLIDGSHTITIRARDEAGHTTSQQLTLIVDNNAPVCAVNSPVVDEYIEGTYVFRLSATDSVGIDRVYVNVFGANFTATFSGASGYYEFTTDTSIRNDGNYRCKAIAYDDSGKMTESAEVNFQIDNNAPQMTINGLQTGAYVEGNVTFNVTATDVYLLDVSYSVDGGTWINIANPWNTNSLLDGGHTVSFRARDMAGHDITQTMTLIVDNTKPVVSINNPSSAEFVEGTYTFRVSAIDQVGIDRVFINVFSNSFLATFSTSSGYYEFTTDTSIKVDGNFKCNATAHDLSGKISTSDDIHFKIDNNAPVLRVLDPLPGDFLEGYVLMSVNSTDIFLNRTEYNVDGTGWVDISIPLNTSIFGDGDHAINIRSVDDAGHITSTSVNVIIDNYAPVGSISFPGTNAYVTEMTPTFKIIASDIVGIDNVAISLDFPAITGDLDMSYNSATGYWEFRTDVTLVPDGEYNMTVTVTDLSGKRLIIGPSPFNVDTHRPEIVVNDLSNGDILSGAAPISLYSRDTYLNLMTYRIDENEPLPLTYMMEGNWANASFLLNTTMYNDGAHTITIYSYDAAGWSSSIKFDIFMDNVRPTCTITSPVTNEFVEGVIDIWVTAFDIVGIDYVMIKVYDLEARVPYNAQSGYYEYSSNTITWGAGEDGIRNVTAIAYDLTGKSFTFGPVFFNVDNRAPTININSPKDGQIVSGMFFFDVDNGDVFKKGTDYNIDGASWQPVSIGWNTMLIPDGPHEVTIRATDLAGHITTETLMVIVDNHDPEISIAGPNDNEFIDDAYLFRVVASDEVGIQKVVIRTAGKERQMSYNTQTGYYEYLLDTRSLLDGTYKVNATVIDLADKVVITSDITYRIDNNAPDLRVESPVKDQLVTGLFAVKASTDDEFPGTVRYAIDGTTWFPIEEPWDTTKVIDGRHTVTIRTVDLAGHRTDFDIEVIVDNTEPVISQATIAGGQVLSGVETLRFYAYDSIGIRQVQLRIGDTDNFNEIYRGEGGLYYEYLFDTRIVADNVPHNLTVRAVDRAGNIVEETYVIKVDNNGPDISLDYYWIEGDQSVNIGEVKEGNSVVFEATIIDPSGVGNVMINIDSSGWREMTPDSNLSNPDTYVLFWPTSGVGEGSHVFQIRTTDKLGNENSISGLINVKEKKEEKRFVDSFKESLPIIWLILFIILIIVLFVLAYTGILTKWAKGEGMPPKSKEQESDQPSDEGSKKKRNPFKRKSPADKDAEDWDHEESS